MSCIPGMPCYGSTPRGCGIDPCHAHKTGTDLVHYNGANLPCSGIDTCDTLTLALQKMDTKICPEALAMSLLTALNSNPSLLNIFCNLVNGCIPVTTTTTTTISPCYNYTFNPAISGATSWRVKKCGHKAPQIIGLDQGNSPITYCLDDSYTITQLTGSGTYTKESLC